MKVDQRNGEPGPVLVEGSLEIGHVLRFIEEQRLLTQWHLEQQHQSLRALLEDKIDTAVASLRDGGVGAGRGGGEAFWMGAEGDGAVFAHDPQSGLGRADHGFAMDPMMAELVERTEEEIHEAQQEELVPQADGTFQPKDAGVNRISSVADKLQSKLSPNIRSGRSTIQKIKYGQRTNDTKLKQFLNGPMDVVLALVILGSTVLTCVSLEFDGEKVNASLDLPFSLHQTEEVRVFFKLSDYVISLFFLADLCARIIAFGWELIEDKLSLIDAAVVLMSSVDTFIITPVQGGDGGSNYGFIRVIRFLRLLKSVRLVRSMRAFDKLRVLVSTISASVGSLVWSMVILFTCQTLAGLLAVQLLQKQIMDESNDRELREWLNMSYGTPSKSMWTMFEVTFSGSWPKHVRPLIDEVSVWYAAFFGVYIAGVVFAIMRVITALFLKDTLDQASKDAEIAISALHKKKEEFGQTLKEIFMEADTSGDGLISWDEFKSLLSHQRTMMYLRSLELEIHEAENLFHLLDDGDGFVSFEEFAGGISRLKGMAKSLDLYTVMNLCKKNYKEISELNRKLDMRGASQPGQAKKPPPIVGNSRSAALSPTASRPLSPTASRVRSARSAELAVNLRNM